MSLEFHPVKLGELIKDPFANKRLKGRDGVLFEKIDDKKVVLHDGSILDGHRKALQILANKPNSRLLLQEYVCGSDNLHVDTSKT